jgi:hypothetical protein
MKLKLNYILGVAVTVSMSATPTRAVAQSTASDAAVAGSGIAGIMLILLIIYGIICFLVPIFVYIIMRRATQSLHNWRLAARIKARFPHGYPLFDPICAPLNTVLKSTLPIGSYRLSKTLLLISEIIKNAI